MKKYCKECGHRCHCIGQGYYVSESTCSTCSCDTCTCEEDVLILKNPIKKNKKYIIPIVWIIFMFCILMTLGCAKEEKRSNNLGNIAEALGKIAQ
jgi:hypothetical protein